MANMTIKNYGSDKLVQFGDCEFETSKVVFASAGTLKKGAILARGADGFMKVWDGSTGSPVAVYVDDDATLSAAGNVPCRALISGKVHKELVLVDDNEPTADQLDALKACGIVALPTTEVNGLDNQ